MSAVDAPAARPIPPSRDAALREAAQKLEAGFLAEMLKASGFGRQPEGFGGGVGEDQFGSFLVEAQARVLVEAGGIGLAESIYAAMTKGDRNG